MQSFQLEARSGAAAQQTLQAQAIVRFYAHAGIERKRSFSAGQRRLQRL
jgi:hypothetical protein